MTLVKDPSIFCRRPVPALSILFVDVPPSRGCKPAPNSYIPFFRFKVELREGPASLCCAPHSPHPFSWDGSAGLDLGLFFFKLEIVAVRFFRAGSTDVFSVFQFTVYVPKIFHKIRGRFPCPSLRVRPFFLFVVDLILSHFTTNTLSSPFFQLARVLEVSHC